MLHRRPLAVPVGCQVTEISRAAPTTEPSAPARACLLCAHDPERPGNPVAVCSRAAVERQEDAIVLAGCREWWDLAAAKTWNGPDPDAAG